MLRKRHRSEKLFSDFHTLQFASVTGMVVFVVLLFFIAQPIPPHQGVGVDLVKVSHSVAMPGAMQEDAMKVSITRDGKIWFGTYPIYGETELTKRIQDRLKDRGLERKVYIVADMRVRWGTVKPVLEAVRSAGILRIAFLVNQRQA